jgi:leucyl/phenylalanyl-tRNA--protein transferase
VEVREEGRLVGGIYGVAIESFFAGESMFHHVTDASKIALCVLMEHLRERQFLLFDTQVLSPLTARLGAIEVRRRDYLGKLSTALRKPACF